MKLSEAMWHWRNWFDRQVAKHGDCGGFTDFDEYVDAQPTHAVIEALIMWGEES